MRSAVKEVARAANCSGHGSRSESSSSSGSSSTVPLQCRHIHRSHRVRATDSSFRQRQIYLELTDRRSFAMLALQLVNLHVYIYTRNNFGSAGTVVVLCGGCTV